MTLAAEIIARDPQRRLGLLSAKGFAGRFPHCRHEFVELSLPSRNLRQPLHNGRFGQGQAAQTFRVLRRKKERREPAIRIADKMNALQLQRVEEGVEISRLDGGRLIWSIRIRITVRIIITAAIIDYAVILGKRPDLGAPFPIIAESAVDETTGTPLPFSR